MPKEQEFFDDLIEPKAVCGNCDYHAQTGSCGNPRSTKYAQHTFDDDRCGRFWPDAKRWPDCDHD